MPTPPTKYALLLLYALSILGANWTIATLGLVPVLPGLMAPAGVYFAGLTFSLRDALHERAGRGWALGAVLLGAALSALISGPLALASGCAFLLSELADLAVYSPLRARGLLVAVALSNSVGLVVDSALFLALAGLPSAALPGLIVGKVWMTLLAVLVLAAVRRRRTQEAL
jgi:uncharacterized PurR-regulated membrane protein YhhQ (DUF165 family)